MAKANVIIVFWSRLGSTEKLALNAAVGAVEGRANIRLRWVKEAACDVSNAAWSETRARMEAEYIQPRVIDIEWAEGIVLATPEGVGPHAKEWSDFLALASFRGKKASLVCNGSKVAQAAWKDAGEQAGLTWVDMKAVVPNNAVVAKPLGRCLT